MLEINEMKRSGKSKSEVVNFQMLRGMEDMLREMEEIIKLIANIKKQATSQ